MKIHNKIKDFYDFDGRDYGYRRWKKYPAARFDYNSTKRQILSYLRKYHFNNALEIGCGPGTWTGILTQFADWITAVDISETRLKKLKNQSMTQRSILLIQI